MKFPDKVRTFCTYKHKYVAFSDKKRYICDKCGKVYRREASLLFHLEDHQKRESRFQCDQCGLKYRTKSGLQTHVDWVHLDRRHYKCDLCSESFK